MNQLHNDARETLNTAQRIVVKVGTRVLVNADGRPDEAQFTQLSQQITKLIEAGKDCVLVSSGAIAAGMEALGFKDRPKTLPELQMAAAVGQCQLMRRYTDQFAKGSITTAQVLLTHDALKHRLRHINARNTLQCLIKNKALAIVNENDTVSVEEIQFGDNDQLAALVSLLIDADLLILLTSINGLHRDANEPQSRVPFLQQVDAAAKALTWTEGTRLGTGGMASKLEAANIAQSNGCAVVIADGRDPAVLLKAAAGEDVGTLIGSLSHKARGERKARFSARKSWLAYFQKSDGQLSVDAGAERALVEQGRSLLAVGVKECQGEFLRGSAVDIHNARGQLIARGVSQYSSQEIRQMLGRSSQDIRQSLGHEGQIIHRDNLVCLHRSAP